MSEMKKHKLSKKQLHLRYLHRADALGWLGAGLLVTAFLLISTEVVEARSFLYQILNLLGAILLTIDGLARKMYPSIATNFFWGGIAIVTIITLLLA